MADNSSPYEMFLVGMADQRNASHPEKICKDPLPSSQVQRELCKIYLHQVDPIYKTLHQPSLRAFLLEGKPYLDDKPEDPAPTALARAVYYVATCSLSEEQCTELFDMSKDTMIAIHQKETDAALLRADFITSTDMTVLQAFALSLVCSSYTSFIVKSPAYTGYRSLLVLMIGPVESGPC